MSVFTTWQLQGSWTSTQRFRVPKVKVPANKARAALSCGTHHQKSDTITFALLTWLNTSQGGPDSREKGQSLHLLMEGVSKIFALPRQSPALSILV